MASASKKADDIMDGAFKLAALTHAAMRAAVRARDVQMVERAQSGRLGLRDVAKSNRGITLPRAAEAASALVHGRS